MKNIILVVLLSGFSLVALATESRELADPPAMSAQEIALAEAELQSGVVEKTKAALASEHGQKLTEEAVPSNEIEYRFYRHGTPIIKGYFEKSLTDDVAVYLSAAKARGWDEATIGPTYYISRDMMVGISLGASRYAAGDEETKSSHLTLSAFWYWKTDLVEAEATVERYSRDPVPVWYNAYFQVPVSESFAVGAFAEKGIGWGPRLSWTFAKNASLWISPLVKRMSDSTLVGGIVFGF